MSLVSCGLVDKITDSSKRDEITDSVELSDHIYAFQNLFKEPSKNKLGVNEDDFAHFKLEEI